MTRKFKPRRNIERATMFKVQYAIVSGGPIEKSEREFGSLKSMRQWMDRNGEALGIVILKTLALIMDKWEPFTTIGKKTVTLSDLRAIVEDLSEDYNPSNTEN